MDTRVTKQLDIMAATVKSQNTTRFIQARKELEQLLEGTETPVQDVTDPLDQVCSVAEYCQQHDLYKVAVHRMIESGQLNARKSGGVWLVRADIDKIVL